MSIDDRKIHIKLSEDLHRKLRVKCAYDDVTIQQYVENLLKKDLAKYEVILREQSPPELAEGEAESSPSQ